MGIVPKKILPGRRIMVLKISTSRYGVTGYTGFFLTHQQLVYFFFQAIIQIWIFWYLILHGNDLQYFNEIVCKGGYRKLKKSSLYFVLFWTIPFHCSYKREAVWIIVIFVVSTNYGDVEWLCVSIPPTSTLCLTVRLRAGVGSHDILWSWGGDCHHSGSSGESAETLDLFLI